MVAVKAADVERSLRSPPAGIDVLLIYGPDAGLVSERAGRAAAAFVADPSDGLQLIRLDGDLVAEQPGRLLEEVASVGLFGGARAIWVRPSGRDVSAALSACLGLPFIETMLVVEAGDLKPSAALRKLCEASPRTLALPCYSDEARDIGTLISETCAAERLSLDPDARALLIDSLGGDRLSSRGELAKLALYCSGTGRITRQDVEAAVSDVSSLSIDAALDAALAGDRRGVDDAIAQWTQHGIVPAAALVIASRHILSLLVARAEIDGGQNVEGALRAWRGLPYRRQPTIKRQIGAWSRDRLAAVLEIMQSAALDVRRQPALSVALLWTAFARVADLAPRTAGSHMAADV